jgi:hypothetical protein
MIGACRDLTNLVNATFPLCIRFTNKHTLVTAVGTLRDPNLLDRGAFAFHQDINKEFIVAALHRYGLLLRSLALMAHY